MKQEETIDPAIGQEWLGDWTFLHRMRRFLIGSGILHVVFLGYMLSNPDWLKEEKELKVIKNEPVLTHIPSQIVDQLLQPSQAAPPPSQQQPKPEQVKPLEPRQKDPVVEPKKEQPKELDPAPKKPQTIEEKPADVPHKISISTKVVKSTPRSKVAPRPQVNPINTRAKALNSTLDKLNKGLSGITDVNLTGLASVAMASYGSVVKTVYNRAWVAPPDLDDDQATTKAEIVILRNGKVKSSRIISKSGISVLDQSIQKTLNTVRFVAPFPDGVEDLERTFVINFNLKSKGIF